MDLTRMFPADRTLTEFLAGSDVLLAALVSAAATLALILIFAPRLALGRAVERPSDPAACEFLLAGSSLKALTEPARALLADLGPALSASAALAAHLDEDCPGVQRQIEALVLDGTPFQAHATRADGSACEITGRPEGDVARLTIRQPTDETRVLQDARAALGRTNEELRFLRDAMDHAPVLAWRLTPDGQVAWANAPYREAFDAAEGITDPRPRNAFGHLLEEVPLTARGFGTRARVSVIDRDGTGARWYELSQGPGPDGSTLGFASEVDDLVAAEAALHRFIETLTETFAHLPIGLAVFDKNRRLGLFNPALTDLVRIDAVWLAGRPSLRDFLERLRETRQMPEQKDFACWRRKLTELEEGARDGNYEENWVLPSGKVFRVTGRPHPQGALAFLFEDISTTIQLERRYRSELELSQATFDRLNEAVAIFDAAGALVFVNAAFEQLWGVATMDRLDGPGVREVTGVWAERCMPTTAWAELAEYATAAETRGSWTAAIETRDGRGLKMSVAPLPDASTLVTFCAAAAALGRDPLLDELAVEQIRKPLEAALDQVATVISRAERPEAFQALGSAAQALRDGLTRARAFDAVPRAGGPLAGLKAALMARGLGFSVSGPDAALADPALRRAALAVGFAASELARPGAVVEIEVDPALAARRVTAGVATGDGAPHADAGVFARRVVEAAGGTLHLEHGAGRGTLIAELPPLAEPCGSALALVAQA